MLEKIGKFKLLIVGVLVSFLFIAITIGQLQKRQETRSRAAGQPISVILEPQTASKNVGEQFDIKVSLNGADNNVSAVDITFTYSKDLLTLASNGITSFGTFTTILNEAGTVGDIHYVGVNPTANPITGSSINLGTLSFRARSAGTATLGFSKIHVNASGVASALPVDTANTRTGTYTITTSNNLSPTPTKGSPTQTPYPTSPSGTACIITSPTAGSTVSGTVEAKATTTVPPTPGTYIYRIFVDSKTIVGGRSYSGGEGTVMFSVPWNTTQFSNGTHTLSCNLGAAIIVTVNNLGQTQSPTPIPGFLINLLDLNGDGKVDEVDLNILYAGFAKRQGD